MTFLALNLLLDNALAAKGAGKFEKTRRLWARVGMLPPLRGVSMTISFRAGEESKEKLTLADEELMEAGGMLPLLRGVSMTIFISGWRRRQREAHPG